MAPATGRPAENPNRWSCFLPASGSRGLDDKERAGPPSVFFQGGDLMDTVTVLRAKNTFGPASYGVVGKYIYKDGRKEIHPNKSYWEVRTHEINDLEAFYYLLLEVTETNHSILLRGKFNRGNHLHCRRNKENFASVPKNWMMVDIDKLRALEGMEADSDDAILYAVQQLPTEFHDADCIALFSSSAGLAGDKIKLHLMFWLEEPQDNNTLKRWAKSQKDLVDPSIYDSVQPHYVTDPTFEDPSMDPFKDRSRLTYFRKNRRTVPGVFLDNFKTPILFKIDSKTPGVLNPDGARRASRSPIWRAFCDCDSWPRKSWMPSWTAASPPALGLQT
jgi:hypothetical protein